MIQDKAIYAHINDQPTGKIESSDSLPSVLNGNHADFIDHRLRLEAAVKFGIHQLPNNLEEWKRISAGLRDEIILKTGLWVDHKLPFNMKETGTVQMKGYSIKNIAFQTHPGIYATANLYIPEGKGPFPAVIFMIGHWELGKIEETGVQPVGHTLATNG
jgi:hypothetical protein